MGIATSTALAIGGMAISAGTAGASFAQAGKQRKLQQQAQADAAKALEEARRRTEVNYYDQLGINKEPYALEREAMLTQGAQAIEAGRESERGVAATAGRIQAQQNLAQQGITSAMGKEMSDLEKLQAQEDSRLRDVNLQLDLGEISGAQQLAADAGEKAAAANKAGFTAATGAVKQGLETFVPLFTERTGQTSAVSATPITAMPRLGVPASTFNQGIATTVPLPPVLAGQRPMMTNVPTGMYQGQGQISYPYNPFQITLPKYP